MIADIVQVFSMLSNFVLVHFYQLLREEYWKSPTAIVDSFPFSSPSSLLIVCFASGSVSVIFLIYWQFITTLYAWKFFIGCSE